MDGLNLAANHLPTYQNACSQMYNDTKASIQELADALYSSHGFPLKEEVGLRANRALPDIIISNTDHVYQEEQLPLIREACEQEQIPWDYYALLFDKIHVFRNGYQRYGTQKFSEEKGSIKFRSPIEDIEMLNEYRKQVKLAPFTADVINETRIRQEHLDSSLIFILNQIYQDDQKYRGNMREVEENSESKTSQQSERWSAMARCDSINSAKISILLDSLGWLGPETIGYHGVDAVFLVLQHADLETQLKYLPMLHDAVMSHQLDASDLAMLEDRVSVKQGKEQIYGTQIGMDSSTGKYYMLPLIEPEKVNERRQQVNLGRIEEYVKRWNITWSID